MSRNTPVADDDMEPDATDEAVSTELVLSAFRNGTALELAPVDADAAQQAIVNRILGAETWEELSKGTTVLKAKDMVNTPFLATVVRFYPSKHYNPDEPKKTPPAFAVIEAALTTETFAGSPGDVVLVSVGGWNCVAFLLSAVSRGFIGNGEAKEVVIRQKETETAAGFKPLWIEGVQR